MATVQGQKVKGQGHKVTCRIGWQKRYNSAVYGRINLKLVGIIYAGVDACGIPSRSVGQTGSRNMADIQHIKCKYQRKRYKIAAILHSNIGNRGRRIERRCLNLHRKFRNNRFCACSVQMLLKMAVNATISSTFEVQCGKWTSTKTTAIGHLGYL